MRDKLNVRAIFHSIDGEANGFGGAGQLTTFIRLSGCNLRCHYCDTKYAQELESGLWMTVDEIVRKVGRSRKITLTGGEPLIPSRREAVRSLLRQLNCHSVDITIETNGTQMPIREFNLRRDSIRYVVDYKLPSSGMMKYMKVPDLFYALRDIDVVKFVISDEEDYKVAKSVIKKYFQPCEDEQYCRARIVFSPMIEDQKDYTGWPRQLAELLMQDNLWDVQYSLQVHKVLWPNAKQER